MLAPGTLGAGTGGPRGSGAGGAIREAGAALAAIGVEIPVAGRSPSGRVNGSKLGVEVVG